MSELSIILCVGLPFAWWGAVVAISVLETPLKFRAPGMTVPLGLGIGRLVFRALNAFELVLAAGVALGMATTARPGLCAWSLLATVVTILLVQAALVRPALDRRAAALIAGKPLPRSRLHLVYVGGEALKLAVLPVLAVVIAA